MEVNEGILRRLRVLEVGGGYRDDGIDNGTGFRDFTYVVLRGNFNFSKNLMEIEFLCKVDFYRTIQLLKLTTRNTHALNFRKSRLPFGVISPFTKLSNLQFHVCCCC